MSTPADELRAAAAKLRETAGRVPQGHDDDRKRWAGTPWATEPCDRGCACIVYQGDYRQAFGSPGSASDGIQYVADAETPEHADWIALMHPGLAKPLAWWLESEAARYDARPSSVTDECAEQAMAAPLETARAILGSQP